MYSTCVSHRLCTVYLISAGVPHYVQYMCIPQVMYCAPHLSWSPTLCTVHVYPTGYVLCTSSQQESHTIYSTCVSHRLCTVHLISAGVLYYIPQGVITQCIQNPAMTTPGASHAKSPTGGAQLGSWALEGHSSCVYQIL